MGWIKLQWVQGLVVFSLQDYYLSISFAGSGWKVKHNCSYFGQKVTLSFTRIGNKSWRILLQVTVGRCWKALLVLVQFPVLSLVHHPLCPCTKLEQEPLSKQHPPAACVELQAGPRR